MSVKAKKKSSVHRQRSTQVVIVPDPPREQLPRPKFPINNRLTVPVAREVADSGWAKIVGIEWGPANARLKSAGTGWVYWLLESGKPGDCSFTASEEELVRWNSGLSD